MIKYFFTLLLLTSAFPVFSQYCIPTYNNQCTSGDYIDGVQIGTINNVGTNCSAPSTTNYTYYNTLTTNLMCGQSYGFTVTPTTAYAQGIGIWIDFNQTKVLQMRANFSTQRLTRAHLQRAVFPFL